MLHGFNEKGQKTLGSITLPLQFDEFQTEAKFHVIDANTSFRALLGRPWLHEYEMVPSTLHQCIKYTRVAKFSCRETPGLVSFIFQICF